MKKRPSFRDGSTISGSPPAIRGIFLFAIWSTTQHYADFSVQVRHVLGLQPGDVSYYDEAARMLETLFLGQLMLSPAGD